MSRRSDVLELATLGLLAESPLHGYELRKRLNAVLGSLRAISYGSLYPCLRGLEERGLIAGQHPSESGRAGGARGARRARIVYELTAEGKEQLQELLGESGPDTWDDERFGVHFAFFGRTDGEVRLRILQGRRSRLEERLANLRGSLGRTSQRVDAYTLELQRHGLEGVEREVRWLSELIASESDRAAAPRQPDTSQRDASQHDSSNESQNRDAAAPDQSRKDT